MAKKRERILQRRERILGPEALIARGKEEGPEPRSLAGKSSAYEEFYVLWEDAAEVHREKIQSGAGTKTLLEKLLPGGAGVLLLMQHDRTQVLASTRSGRLEVEQRKDGLYWRVPDIGKAHNAEQAWIQVDQGDVREGSFGFYVDKSYTNEYKGKDERLYYDRVITEFELVEVSIVVRGANPNTETMTRSQAFAAFGFEDENNRALAEQEDSTGEPVGEGSEAGSAEVADSTLGDSPDHSAAGPQRDAALKRARLEVACAEFEMEVLGNE